MGTWKLLVTLEAGGKPLRFSQEIAEPSWSLYGTTLTFNPVVAGLSVPERGTDSGDAQMELPASALRYSELMKAGVFLPAATAEIALWKEGTDWSHREILLNGFVKPDGIVRDGKTVKVAMGDGAWASDVPFPPRAMEAGEFAQLNSSDVGSTFHVFYGRHRLAPLVQVTQLDDSLVNTQLVRLVIAGHRIRSPSIFVMPSGSRSDGESVMVQTKTCGVTGQLYSYVDLTYAFARGGSSWVAELDGYQSDGAGLIEGLGDVVTHLIAEYGRLPPDRVDQQRMSRFRARANRVPVSMMFGGSAAGDTLLSTIKSRVEASFPVLCSWRGGMWGADWLPFDPAAGLGRSLSVEGGELLSRVPDSVKMALPQVYSSFRVFYAPNTLAADHVGNPRLTANMTRDKRFDERCAEAYSCWGDSVYPPKQLFEVNSGTGAAACLDGLIDTKGVQRTLVQYVARTDVAIRLGIFERYPISDAELGWVRESFRLEKLAVHVDNPDLCDLTFRSFGGNRKAP